jgi:hypothetical protein
MKTTGAILRAILLVCLVLGCNLVERDLSLEQGDPTDTDKGAVTIVFSSGIFSAKTLTPPVDMDVATLYIQGILQGGGGYFEDTVGVNDPFSQYGLIPGFWDILVDAKNIKGTTIGHGAATAHIVVGSSITVQIEITPLSGQGGLDLTVQWPKKVYSTVRIDAYLTLVGTANPVNLVFDIKPQNPKDGSYTNNNLATGYYLLTIQMYGDEQFVWGTAEAVRIVAGATTVHVFDLN